MRYSQKGMATVENKNGAADSGSQPNAQPGTPSGAKPGAKSGAQGGFVYLPLIAGWLVPGAGHFLLRKWGRGALLSGSILAMFVLGLMMQGKLYSNAHEILDMLGLAGDLGAGLLYIVSQILGLGAAQVQTTLGDYGTRFIVVAGLLNVVAAVDAHNLRTGRKS